MHKVKAISNVSDMSLKLSMSNQLGETIEVSEDEDIGQLVTIRQRFPTWQKRDDSVITVTREETNSLVLMLLKYLDET